MHFHNIFVQVVSFFLVGQWLIHALPAEAASLETRASIPCDDISKYTLEVSQCIVDIANSHFANPSFNFSIFEAVTVNALPRPPVSSTHADLAKLRKLFPSQTAPQ